mmetsp:Transcript_19188/g.28396  ORF Transcript_19188/g.28396 Transcript_19188/m.28396 type:complete len:226 (+) Transcript_19188:73-750(+)
MTTTFPCTSISIMLLQLLLVVSILQPYHHLAAHALKVVIAGGTGRLGPRVASQLKSPQHEVMLLSRNAFLATAPNRVTGVFGYVGASFLDNNPHVSVRDWDGGDLTDIVGCDWMGWQEDALVGADVVLNLVGGYTEQREMATERLVKESLRLNNRQAVQITVSPNEEDIKTLTPGAVSLKKKRLERCEEMVKQNCLYSKCLRLEAFDYETNAAKIVEAVLESASA